MKINLKTLPWIASFLSITGVILNAQHLIICWFIWCLANTLWIYISLKKKDWSQFILWVIFTLSNVYGYFSWLN